MLPLCINTICVYNPGNVISGFAENSVYLPSLDHSFLSPSNISSVPALWLTELKIYGRFQLLCSLNLTHTPAPSQASSWFSFVAALATHHPPNPPRADSSQNSCCRWLCLSSLSFPIPPWVIAWLSSPQSLHHVALIPVYLILVWGDCNLTQQLALTLDVFDHCVQNSCTSHSPALPTLSQLPRPPQPNFFFLSSSAPLSQAVKKKLKKNWWEMEVWLKKQHDLSYYM